MPCIFVAYGDPDCREAVLEFAVNRAAVSGDDLLVHHIRQSQEASDQQIRGEIDSTVERVAPQVTYEVQIDSKEVHTDAGNVSKQKRLTNAILQDPRDFVYVIMGNIERGIIEEITLSSMTEAVLETHEVPVLLVPA